MCVHRVTIAAPTPALLRWKCCAVCAIEAFAGSRDALWADPDAQSGLHTVRDGNFTAAADD